MDAVMERPVQLGLGFWEETAGMARGLREAEKAEVQSLKVEGYRLRGRMVPPTLDPRPKTLDPCASYRRTDPGTSAEAAREMVVSGKLGEQQIAVLDAVRRWPGRTSAELAAFMGVGRQMPARRLPELEAAGRVVDGEGVVLVPGKISKGMARGCGECGRRCVTWWPED